MDDLYSAFDSHLAERHAYKIDTIGDAYVVVSGLYPPEGEEFEDEVSVVDKRNTTMYPFSPRPDGKPEACTPPGLPTGSQPSSLLVPPSSFQKFVPRERSRFRPHRVSHAVQMVLFGLDLIQEIERLRVENPIFNKISMRIGVHTGKAVVSFNLRDSFYL